MTSNITLNQLKILTGYLVSEAKDLTKSDKLKILESIANETSIHDLMSLLLDGKRFESDDEVDKLKLEGRFIASELFDELQEVDKKLKK